VLDYFGNQIDPSQYVWKPGKYFSDFTLTSLQLLTNQAIQLRGQEQYFAIFKLMSVQTNPFRVKLYTTGGDTIPANSAGTTDRIRSECLYGTASLPAVLPGVLLIPGSGSILHDLEEILTAGNSLHLVYEGWRLFPR